MSLLAAHSLKKAYGQRTVVHDVSLEVNSGEIVGLLGPNGAGKTTCFYMIVGLVLLMAAALSSMARIFQDCQSTAAREWGLPIFRRRLPFFAN